MYVAAILVSAMVLSVGETSLCRAGAEAWRPRARPQRSTWCTEHVQIPARTGAQPGPFDLIDHPYLREILDAVDDPEVRKIVFLGATQLGKTELVKAILLSQGEVARAPMMFAGPDQMYVREQRDAVYHQAEQMPLLAPRIPPPRLRNDRFIDLERCLIYLAWSGSRQRLSGRSCKLVLCSEVDRWRNPPSMADERTKAFPDNSCVVYEGTPVDASPYLEDEYQQTDRRTFEVPCPKCGHWQGLRFFPHRSGAYAGCGGVAGLQPKAGGWLTPDEARKAAYYLCEKGCRIAEVDRMTMIRKGIWVPEGCAVSKAGKITGTPANPCRRRGYRVNSLYSKTITFGAAAERYLLARDNSEKLKRFFNDWLGMRFLPRGTTPRWKDLGARLAGAHLRGTVPRGAYFLTATADVQERGVYWVVRAWGDGKTSWLVDFGYCPKRTLARLSPAEDPSALADEELAGDLAQLDAAILRKRWNVDGENPRGFSQLAVRVLGIDRGYRPTDVVSFLRAHPGTRVIAVFGDPKITPGSLFRPMKTERSAKDGKPVDEDPRTWGIDTSAYKSEIADRWQADRTRAGAWWLPADILSTPGGEDYLRQITAETKRLDEVKGRKVVRWSLISHEMPNHWGDCETYNACLADMVTGNEWDASQWPDPARRPRPAAEDAPDPGLHAREDDPDFSAR